MTEIRLDSSGTVDEVCIMDPLGVQIKRMDTAAWVATIQTYTENVRVSFFVKWRRPNRDFGATWWERLAELIPVPHIEVVTEVEK